MWDLAPDQGFNSVLAAQSLNHWATGKVPGSTFLHDFLRTEVQKGTAGSTAII